MAQDNEIKLQIGVETDESSIARAKRSIDGLEDSVKDVARELSRVDDKADFAQTTREAQKLERAVEAIGDAAKQTGRDLQTALDQADRRFSQTSQNVALAGDAESNLRTVGGAIGAFGGQGAEQAIGAGAEIFAVTEALPRLKESLAAFPQTATAAAQALGTTTGALGALGVATIALGAALAIAQKAQQERTKVAEGAVAALLNQNDLERLSTEQLIETQQQYQSELQNQQEDLATAKAALAQFEEALGPIGRIFAELGNLFGVSGTELGVLRGEITRLSGDSTELKNNLSTTNRILEERGVTETAVSQQAERTNSTLDATADAQRQFADILNQAQSQTAQTNTATSGRIASERQYQTVLQQTSTVASQSSAEQRRAANRAAGEQDRARAQERRQRIADTVARIRDRQRGEQEEVQAAADNRGEILRDFYNREANELVQHQRNLEDIRLSAQRAERDALRSGDIFALRDIRERASDQLSDAGRDFQFNQGMRAREFAQSNNNVTFNITNADPQAVAYQIQRQLAGTLR